MGVAAVIEGKMGDMENVGAGKGWWALQWASDLL